jgi:hypothetical protein
VVSISLTRSVYVGYIIWATEAAKTGVSAPPVSAPLRLAGAVEQGTTSLKAGAEEMGTVSLQAEVGSHCVPNMWELIRPLVVCMRVCSHDYVGQVGSV